MRLIGGKNAKKKTSSSSTKRNFTVVMGNKEHGLYVSSSPSSAARKAVSKLCATDKKKKVDFSIREITQGSKKKTYGPYKGYIEKLKEPIELKGRVIRYKPVAKLSGKSGAKKGGMMGGGKLWITDGRIGYVVTNEPSESASWNATLFRISYLEFIYSEAIFNLLRFSTGMMEEHCQKKLRGVPGETVENKLKRNTEVDDNLKRITTVYLVKISYIQDIKPDDLQNIFIYISKAELIDQMKEVKQNGKSFIQTESNKFVFE